jgi:hypothetical protein
LHPCPQHWAYRRGNSAKLAKREFFDIDWGLWRHRRKRSPDKTTWANWNGWYLDLPAVGERLLKPYEFYDASNLLTVWSQVPAKGSNVDPNVESCESTSVDSERQYRTFVNIMDGKAPSIAIVDKNKDGKFLMSLLATVPPRSHGGWSASPVPRWPKAHTASSGRINSRTWILMPRTTRKTSRQCLKSPCAPAGARSSK